MDVREINSEIKRLENSDTTYTNCDKLATLYAVRDGLNPNQEMKANVRPVNYSHASPQAQEGASPFIDAYLSADAEKALEIVDEHFETIRILYPREYEKVIRKLNTQ